MIERTQLHYVTAREMTNLVRAAEQGLDGPPDAYRNYWLKPPAVCTATRQYLTTSERGSPGSPNGSQGGRTVAGVTMPDAWTASLSSRPDTLPSRVASSGDPPSDTGARSSTRSGSPRRP